MRKRDSQYSKRESRERDLEVARYTAEEAPLCGACKQCCGYFYGEKRHFGTRMRSGPKTGRKSMGKAASPGSAPGAPAIPDKLYFRIGEVAALCCVPTYVLRFWQTEFAQLRPGKSGTGQRLYRRRDVEMALRIKQLLHEQGYTIAGARGVLADEAAIPPHLRLAPAVTAASAEPETSQDQARLRALRGELQELLTLLERRPMLDETASGLLREPGKE